MLTRFKADIDQLRAELSRDGFVADMEIILDDVGNVLAISDAHNRILGYERCRMIGQPVFDYVHPQDADHLRQKVNDAVHTKRTVRTEYRAANRKQCEWTAFECVISPLVHDGDVVGYISFSRRKNEPTER